MKHVLAFINFPIKSKAYGKMKIPVHQFYHAPLIWGYYANSTDSVQKQQNVASGKGQHFLLTRSSLQNIVKVRPLKLEMGSSK